MSFYINKVFFFCCCYCFGNVACLFGSKTQVSILGQYSLKVAVELPMCGFHCQVHQQFVQCCALCVMTHGCCLNYMFVVYVTYGELY